MKDPIGKLTKTNRWTKPERCAKKFIYTDGDGLGWVKINGRWYVSDSVNA